MKKIVVFTVFLIGLVVSAQNAPENKHTVKLGVIKTLLGQGLDVSYENTFSSSFSVGSNLYVAFVDRPEVTQIFAVQPFARGYFTEAEDYGSKGFFVEVFMSLGGEKEGEYITNTNTNTENLVIKEDFQTALGFGLGWKWVNEGGFVLEVNGGVGRKLINNDIHGNYIFKGDVQIGYTF